MCQSLCKIKLQNCMGAALAKPQNPHFWRELYEQLLPALNDGTWVRFSGYTVAGRSFSNRTLEDFRKFLAWVEARVDREEGRASFRRRAYAGQGGRG